MPMTDRRVAQLGRKHKEAQTAEKDWKAIKDELAEKIVPELDRRGTRQLDTNGVKVTKIAPEETQYDWDELASRLTARQLRSIQVEAVDRTKLAEAVQEGRIDSAVVAQCTRVVPKKPYVSVTFTS